MLLTGKRQRNVATIVEVLLGAKLQKIILNQTSWWVMWRRKSLVLAISGEHIDHGSLEAPLFHSNSVALWYLSKVKMLVSKRKVWSGAASGGKTCECFGDTVEFFVEWDFCVKRLNIEGGRIASGWTKKCFEVVGVFEADRSSLTNRFLKKLNDVSYVSCRWMTVRENQSSWRHVGTAPATPVKVG